MLIPSTRPPFIYSGNNAAIKGYPTLKNVIDVLGLSTNLKLCLDPGDATSYTSGQSWLDTSGNGYDFFRGTTGSSEASDPTFNGLVGGRNLGNYWSFDGGDRFTYDTTNETWMQNIHKDNAKFTMIAWVYLGSVGIDQGLWGTSGIVFGGVTGFQSVCRNTSVLGFAVINSDSIVKNIASTATFSATTWTFLALSLDEAVGSNGAFFQINSSVDLANSTYTSPSAGNASWTLQIGDKGNSSEPLSNNSRLGMFAVWEGVALTQTNVSNIYTLTRTRFNV